LDATMCIALVYASLGGLFLQLTHWRAGWIE
jgi:hypothetical protein